MKTILFLTVLLMLCVSAYGESLAPAEIPQIVINQGEDFSKSWRLTSCTSYSALNACTGKRVPIDIRGVIIKATGKKNYSDVTPFINFSTSTFSNLSGAFRLSLSKSKTSKFTQSQTGYVDMYIQWLDGTVQYIIKSTFLTKPTVTH